jgi:hypothetical protein
LWSAADPVIATVMRGILRAQKRPVRPAAALTSVEIKQLLATCDDGLIGRPAIGRAALPGLRDCALLLTCFAGGLRRAELVALDLGQELTLRYAVAGQLVSDEDARRILQTLQQPLEEALCRSRIAVALHPDIEHDPILIDGAPKITPFASDTEENLVEVPLVARTRPSPTKLPGKGCTELQAPSADALIGDNHAALGQEQLDVAKAQTEHVVEPDRVPDQLSREAVTIVRIGRLLHLTSLA